VGELGNFLVHREVAGWVLLGTMLFFSSLAFSMLESAMSVIFRHRVEVKARRFIISALLPYFFMLLLGVGFMIVTVVAGGLQALGKHSVHLFGSSWSLDPISLALLYLIGVGGEILLLSALYLVMPVGRLSWRSALLGRRDRGAPLGSHAARAPLVLLDRLEGERGVRSLTTAIVVLLSLEIAATLVLFGAQVIAEYERLERSGS
jgi:uncharacterized BrkB/YihY/UPF0761 family membrane protein